MAYIVGRRVNGKKYFMKVEGYRKNGKVKQRVIEYYGVKDPRKDPAALPLTKKSVVATRRFGDAALLYSAALQISLIDVVNRYVPKRQGLSLGLELFLVAAHRLLDDKPSSCNLSRWVETTHLPLLLGFDASKLTTDSQDYLMDKLFNKERNVDHLFRISKDLYDATLPLFGKEGKTFFYDLTSTYFEGRCCPIAKMGYNRDGDIDRLQVNIGMVVNGAYGIPIMTKVFEGNINDAITVYEMAYYMRFAFGKKEGLLIMDRGMDSEDNVRILDAIHYDFIVGLRANHGFVEKLKRTTDATSSDWESLDKNGVTMKLKKFGKNVFGKRRTVLLYYNPEIARLQRELREKRVENAVAVLKKTENLTFDAAKEAVRGLGKYVIVTESGTRLSWRVDKVALNKAERQDGKFCLLTNVNAGPREIFGLYFSKDKIEKGFRSMKQDADLHPTRKRLTDHVIADVFVCHIAYLLLRAAEQLARQKKIDVFWDGLSSETREIRLLEQQDGNRRRSFQIVANNEKQKAIVEKLELSKQMPFITTSQK